MFNKPKEVNKEIKLNKADKILLGHILNEHSLGIDEDLKDPRISNKDKSSLRRELRHVVALKVKLGL